MSNKTCPVCGGTGDKTSEVVTVHPTGEVEHSNLIKVVQPAAG